MADRHVGVELGDGVIRAGRHAALHGLGNKLAAARGRVVAASQQLADIDQIGVWRPSRWTTRGNETVGQRVGEPAADPMHIGIPITS